MPILAADGYRHWQGFLLLQPPSLVLIGCTSASCCPRPLSSLLVFRQLPAVHVLSRPYWLFLSFLLSTSSLVLTGRSSASCCPRPLSSLLVVRQLPAVHVLSRPYGSFLSFLLSHPLFSSLWIVPSSLWIVPSSLWIVPSSLWVVPELRVVHAPSPSPYGSSLLLTGRFRYFCCSQPQSTKKKSSLALKRCHMNTATKTRTA